MEIKKNTYRFLVKSLQSLMKLCESFLSICAKKKVHGESFKQILQQHLVFVKNYSSAYTRTEALTDLQ